MDEHEFKPKQFMATLRILYLALVVGIVIFLAIVINMLGNDNLTTPETIDTLFLVNVVLTASLLPGAYLVSNRLFDQIDREESLAKKLTQYQSGFIVRLGMMEASALFSVVVLLLTSNISSLGLFTISIALMAFNYPTPEKIGKAINLSEEEKNQLF